VDTRARRVRTDGAAKIAEIDRPAIGNVRDLRDHAAFHDISRKSELVVKFQRARLHDHRPGVQSDADDQEGQFHHA
jgi:hypothetical protein